MLGLRLNRLGAAIQSWIPENLFVGGTAGALYDLDRAGLNFNTTAGVTESTAAADPLGLLIPANGDGRGIVNLFVNSSGIGESSWLKTRTSVSQTNLANPLTGRSDGCKVMETADTGAHYIYAASGFYTYISGQPYIIEAWVEAAERDEFEIVLPGGGFGVNKEVTFNLTDETTSTADTGITYGLDNLGSGLYRAWVAGTATATASANTIALQLHDENGASSYTGDITKGIYVYGLSLRNAATTGEYQANGPLLGGPELPIGQATAGSRPSLASYPRGGRRNLLTYSEDFSNAVWTKTDTTLASSVLTQGAAGTGILSYSTSITVPAGSTISVTFSTKNVSGATWIRLRALDASAADGATAWFNLDTGSVGTTASTGSGTYSASTITANTQGGYDITLTAVLPIGRTSAKIDVLISDADNSNTRASTVQYGAYFAQLEAGSPTAYQKVTSNFLVSEAGLPSVLTAYLDGGDYWSTYTTTLENKVDGNGVVNLLKYTNRFNISPWTGTDTTITANTTAGPDGEVTADTLTEGTAGNASWSQTLSTTDSGDFTGTISVKYNGTQWRELHITDSAGNTLRCWFDVLNGVNGGTPVVAGTATYIDQTITAEANGFYRCTLSGNFPGARTTLSLSSISADADASTVRVNNASYYYANAQLNAGATALTYQGNDATLGGSAGSASLACVPDQQWTVGIGWSSVSSAAQYILAKASSNAATHTLSILLEGGVIKPRVHGTQSTGPSGLADGLFKAVLIVWDGTDAVLYMRGHDPQSLNIGTAAEETSELITIGCRTYTSPAVFFAGTVDPPLLLPRAMTASEATQWLNFMSTSKGVV